MPSGRSTALHRNASSRAQMSSAATAAFNDEQIAEAFLERLKITAENDDVANGLIHRFTGHIRTMQEGRRPAPFTKLVVANVLIDEEPTMVEEYMELFDKCCFTYAWAGKVSPAPEHMAMLSETPEADHEAQLDAHPGGPQLPTPLQPSASGSSSRRRQPTHGKREWIAMAKRLVPEGRGSYALWFTVGNIAVIVSVFAYMAGDYAMWVKKNRSSFLADESIPANTDMDAEV